jgi:hypothetical protein
MSYSLGAATKTEGWLEEWLLSYNFYFRCGVEGNLKTRVSMPQRIDLSFPLKGTPGAESPASMIQSVFCDSGSQQGCLWVEPFCCDCAVRSCISPSHFWKRGIRFESKLSRSLPTTCRTTGIRWRGRYICSNDCSEFAAENNCWRLCWVLCKSTIVVSTKPRSAYNVFGGHWSCFHVWRRGGRPMWNWVYKRWTSSSDSYVSATSTNQYHSLVIHKSVDQLTILQRTIYFHCILPWNHKFESSSFVWYSTQVYL